MGYFRTDLRKTEADGYMKIAFISLMGGAPWGGSEALWNKTAMIALEQGHQVFISVYKWDKIHPKISELQDKGAIVNLRDRYNPSLPFLRKLTSYANNNLLKSSSDFKKLWNFKPDVVLINQGNNFDMLVHHYSLYEEIKKHQVPFFLLCHSHSQYGNIPDSKIYPRGREVFLNAKKVFFVSERQKKLTERVLCINLDNAVITWNPLNLKETRLIEWPKEKVIQFAVVGSLDSNKGHDTLFEVLSQHKWKGRDWHLNIYGEGYGKEYLIDLAEFFKISDRITFHGFVNDIVSVLRKNHILLIPSAGEGLPISLCEAMICGRPAVVTDVGGNTEMIYEGETGFIAEAPTVSSFAEAMERAWTNKNRWEEMAGESHKFASQKIDLESEKKLINILTGTVG